MTEKYAKRFERVVIVAAILWALAFAVDLIVPWLYSYLNPSTAHGHGGVGILIATPVCIVAVVIALIVCLVRSKKENKD